MLVPSVQLGESTTKKQKEEMENNKAGRPRGSVKKKMSKSEVQDLISKSLNRVLNEHLSYTQYVEWISSEYRISANQANQYWLRTWSQLQEKYQLEKDQLITKHLKKYWDLYDMGIERGDLSNSRQVLNDISKLLGMSEPEALNIKQELKIRFKFGTDDKNEE